MDRLINRGVLVFPTIIFVVLSVLSNAAVSSTIEGAIYVHPNNSSCSELLNFTTSCSTLACYTQEENIRKYFTSNTKMVFLSGVHRLCGNPQISSVHNLIMTASEDAMFMEGIPQPYSIIECQYGRAGFHFSNSSSIQLYGLKFNSCGANFTIHNKFPIVCALCFEGIHNVNITQLVTNNSIGFGIHFDNSYGSINICNSAFLHSHIRNCGIHGGNTRFYFGQGHNISCPNMKTNILIQSSWFMHGNDRYPCFHMYDETNNSPGLTIFIQCPFIQVYIDNITAANNTGENGGNIAISLTDFFENSSHIIINNSHIRHGIAYKGGGLRIWSYYAKHKKVGCTYRKKNIVLIENTDFFGNKAIISAGGVYINHYESLRADCIPRQIVFINCSFTSNFISSNNSRDYELRGGAALKILKLRNKGFTMHTTPQLTVTLCQCNFSFNYILHTHGYKNQKGAIIDILGMGYVKISDCSFVSNSGTALSAGSSNIILQGSILFKENQAAYGGALKLCDSSLLYLQNNTEVHFIGNQANFTGGAIYAEEPCLDTVPACFFQVIVPKRTQVESLKNMIKLVFENNSAKIAGDAIYGGAIDVCYTYQLLSNSRHQYSYFYSNEIFNTTFDLTGQTGFTRVSSNPYAICLCKNNKPDCGNQSTHLSVYPGQVFNISVVAVGQMNGTSPAYIVAILADEETPSHTLVTYNTHIQTAYHRHRYQCTTIKYSLVSNRSNGFIHFSLLMSGSSDSASTHVRIHYPNVSLTIKPCPWGFALTSTFPYKCDCDPLLQKYDVWCDINNHTIYIDKSRLEVWIGSHTIKGRNDSELVLISDCDFQYCNMKPQNITLSTIDYQCLSGHTGVMCKSCSPGYTLALGTSHCLKNCSNKNAAWLLVLCLLSGILLVVILLACNLTVTEGTINGLIFYANIVHLNHDIFFKKDTVTINFFRIFIAWLNLDFGFEVCFYKDLDAFQKVWLQFGYVFYIWIVQIVIIVLSHKFIFFTRLVGRNVVKVMATLFLLCYAKVMRYIIFTFEYALLRDSKAHHDSYTVVWFHDGSVEYLKGKHILLFVVAIFLSLLMTFFTLVMLFIQFLQKQTEYRCLRWINRLRPFFDANTGSCKDHYRFWPGLLYFMRASLTILYSIAQMFKTLRINVIMTGTMAACIMILIVACVTPQGVYKKWPLNILEFFFFLNLFILCLSRLIIHKFAVLYSSISFTMLTFIGILIYHTYKEFKTSRIRRALVTWNMRRQLRLNQTVNNDTGALRCQVEVANDVVGQESDCEVSDEQKANEDTPLLHQEMPPVIRFDQYREPLIEGTND